MLNLSQVSSSAWVQQALPVLLVALLTTLNGCAGENRTAKKLAEDSSAAQSAESQLTLNQAILEQVDEKGRLIWKVQAQQASYLRNRQVASVLKPTGELYQDGQLVFRVTADQGEVQQDGQTIFLKGQITATDVREGVVLRGQELEWRPQEDVLIVRHQITGTHAQLEAAAQEAKAYSRSRRILLIGQVKAKTKDPELQLVTEQLEWKVAEKKLLGTKPIQIDRYEDGTVTVQAIADSWNIDLAAKRATLKPNAQVTSLDPPMQTISNSLVWNVKAETVISDQAMNIIHTGQEMMLTGERGKLDLNQQIADLSGNVRGVGKKNQSQLSADYLRWFIPSQEMQAEGNVHYRQADPPLNLSGAKAFGKLQDQTIVVSSGQTERVVTEINP